MSRFLYAIVVNKKLGFIDITGRVVIEPQFDDYPHFVHHEGAVDFSDWVPVRHRRRWGFIDAKGEFKVEPKFDAVDWYSEDLAAAGFSTSGIPSDPIYVPNIRWGYIDRKGAFLLPPTYGAARPFRKGLAIVSAPGPSGEVNSYSGRYGIVNRGGRFVVEPKHWRLYQWGANGLAMAADEEQRKGFLNEEGSLVIPHNYVETDDFVEGFGRVHMGQRSGLMDSSGEVIFWSHCQYPNFHKLPPNYPLKQYEKFGLSLSEGLVLDAHGGRAGFRDTEGKVVIDYQFDDALPFSEGIAAVKIKQKWGFINREGVLVIPATLDEPASFNEGLVQAKVKVTKLDASGKRRTLARLGFMDQKGEMVIEPRFTKPDHRPVQFRQGLARVVHDKCHAYVNKSGRIVWQA